MTASAGGTPAFCMYRTLSAMPPTFAGVTRLTNDEASCGLHRRHERQPLGDAADQADGRGDVGEPDITTAPASHPQLADPRASTLSSTLASWGSRT